MAAKESYRIPFDLNESYGNMEIALTTKDGSVGRVVPLKFILTVIMSGLVCLYIVLKTYIGSHGIPLAVLFCILWAALTALLTSYDKTRRMNVQLVMTLFNYLPSSARKVFTRRNHSANPFYSIAGIEKVEKDGLVVFADQTFGRWYRVVGSASILLFDADKNAIVSRVDNFYRKWSTDTEIVFMTAKESQKVYHQVSNLWERYNNMKNDDKDLRKLAEEQFRILKEYVGHEFKSIHQYMLIKSTNKEMLRRSENVLRSEVENSNLMIKQCVPLDKDEIMPLLASIYQKGDS